MMKKKSKITSFWKPSFKFNWNNKKTKIKPINFFHQFPKKRTIAEKKLINKDPFGDYDKDGVRNIFDCKPFDRRRQGIYRLPQTKAKHYSNMKKSIPIILRHGSDKQIIEVLGRKGGTVYLKDSEEKLADLQKEYPPTEDFEGYTKESILELEKGNTKRILAKGRTPGKIILQQTTWKSVPTFGIGDGNNYKEKKIGQLVIFDTKTGDTEKFKEYSKFTKKEIEEERKDRDMEEQYHPISERYNIEEMDDKAEVLNESPEILIRNQREKLRAESRDSRLNPEYDYRYGFSEEEQKTADAFVNVINEDEPDYEREDFYKEEK